MRLSSLIASNDGLTLHGDDVDITGITADSRNVKSGFLFVAIPGTKDDGRHYLEDALSRGAAALLVPEATESFSFKTFLTTKHIRQSVSYLAAKFYPLQPQMIAAVTGTSGKTSTAQFVREMWQSLGDQSASIGTLGLITENETQYGSLTTPDAISLHQMLDKVAREGVTHVALEASSHGISLNRLDHVSMQVAAFTNLSRDHLDYHGTMASYLEAKLRLFKELLKPGSVAVLNADIPEFEVLQGCAHKSSLKVITYGKLSKDIRLIKSNPHAQGQILELELFGKKQSILLPIIGGFQAFNGLCALGMVIGSGKKPIEALESLEKVTAVPGRLQFAGATKENAAVFIDYAHKPDALENVLKALRPHVAAHKGAQLGVIFGCGGNRDKGKRPIMGEIAQRLADWVIVTDDNPRHEEPALIRKEILAACLPGPTLKEIGDRAKAIEVGIGQLKTGDVLVIAGKGHESGQTIGDQVLPFDDAEMARKVLNI